MNMIYGVVLALTMIVNVQSVMFDLQPNSQKCLRQDIDAHVLVAGEYQVSEAVGQKVDFSTKDSKGHILAQKEDVPHGKEWKFTFSTETYETFEVCFVSHVPNHMRGMPQEITLITKRGLEAKSYEGIGEAAKLKPIEVELKRLEDLSANIVQDFARMRQREEQMRDTNETTNARVLYFSIFSMCCLLGLATWQVFYLRRFFRAKKLIE